MTPFESYKSARAFLRDGGMEFTEMALANDYGPDAGNVIAGLQNESHQLRGALLLLRNVRMLDNLSSGAIAEIDAILESTK